MREDNAITASGILAHGPLAWIDRRAQRVRAWDDAHPGRGKSSYWRCFNLAFVLLACFCVGVYLVNGRAILWRTDGYEQYYPFFAYEGEWLRGIISSLLSGQGLQIPAWQFGLGYGSDVIISIDSIFDPVNLLSALVPVRYSEYLYQVLIIFRLWLAGVGFSLYALKRGRSRFATLLGSLTYAFSISLLEGLVWPGFLVGGVLFPFVLLGVEKVFRHERPYVLVVSLAVLLAASYYFAYMILILLVAYCVVRVVQIEHGFVLRPFLGWTARIGGGVLLAALLSCAALVPSVLEVLSLSRATTTETTQSLLYSFTYYLDVVPGLVGSYSVGSDCNVGYGAAAFVSCVLLYLSGKGRRALKVALVAMTAMLLIPAVGSALNGFNYATNRWVFAYAMLVAYVVSVMAEDIGQIDLRRVLSVLGVTAVLAAWIFLIPRERTEENVASLLAIVLVVALLLVAGSNFRVRRAVLVLGVLGSLCLNMFYFIDANEGGWAATSLPIGSVYQRFVGDSPLNAVAQVDDDSFWRYDVDPARWSSTTDSYRIPRNGSLLFGLNGYTFYSSVYNSSIDRFQTELGLNDDGINFSYRNLEGRAVLEELLGTKYYLVPDDGGETTAYGYDNPVSTTTVDGHSYTVYQGDSTLPLGFAFSGVITRSQYESLSMLERQEALLQGVVLSDDDAASTSVATAKPSLSTSTVESSVVATSGCTVGDGQVVATSDNATVTLSVAGLANSETYLVFNNLDYEPESVLSLISSESFSSKRWYLKAKELAVALSTTPATAYSIYGKADKGSTNRCITNFVSSSHMYGGKREWTLNLGYSQDAQSTVTITFSNAGTYTFDGMSIACQPMDAVSSEVSALSANALENIQVGTNTVSGTISVDAEKMLFLSIPWSQGWSATVDGEPVELIQADTAFMAIDLSAGTHDVVLTYRTPGLDLGLALTGAGLLVAVGLVVVYERRAHRPKGD